MKKLLSIFLVLMMVLAPWSAALLHGATGCNYPTSLDTWTDKSTGDFLTVADVNQRSCAIEKLESGPLRPNLGSVTAPAYSFTGDTNTGIYSSAADSIDFATAGVRALGIDSSQRAFFGGSSATAQVDVNSQAAGRIGLIVNTAASPTADGLRITVNGTGGLQFLRSGSQANVMNSSPFDNSASIGTRIELARNSNATTPAPGYINLTAADAADARIWSDNSGLLRINEAADPTNANLTSGTVVGDQTSWWELKDIVRKWDDPSAALQAVLSTAIFDFHYRDSSYLDADNEPALFTGVVGYDKRDWFLKNVGRQQVPSLNEINAIGYLVLSVQALNQKIERLEARIQ